VFHDTPSNNSVVIADAIIRGLPYPKHRAVAWFISFYFYIVLCFIFIAANVRIAAVCGGVGVAGLGCRK